MPAFKKPAAKNAAGTLSLMAVFAVTMFLGITYLAIHAHVHSAETQSVFGLKADTYKSALAQIGIATFGDHSLGFYLLTVFTAAILVLAANTAFNGFPNLASILAADSFLPRQFRNRGDRLVYSNGIIILAAFSRSRCSPDSGRTRLRCCSSTSSASLFPSPSASSAWCGTGSARSRAQWWPVVVARTELSRIRSERRSSTPRAVSPPALVLVIVVADEVSRRSLDLDRGDGCALRPDAGNQEALHPDLHRARARLRGASGRCPSRVHAVVLVSKIHKPTLRALAYARATHPHTLEALTVAQDAEEADRLRTEWTDRGLSDTVPLRVLSSPFREITAPLLEYVVGIRRKSPRDLVVVYIPEYVVGHWWEQILHNQTPLRIKSRLLFQPGVMVTSVPYQLDSSESGRDPRAPAIGPVAHILAEEKAAMEHEPGLGVVDETTTPVA